MALPREVRLTADVLNRMIHKQAFRIPSVSVRSSSKFSRTMMSLCFTRAETFPISGFPRKLHDEKAAPLTGEFPPSPVLTFAHARNASEG